MARNQDHKAIAEAWRLLSCQQDSKRKSALDWAEDVGGAPVTLLAVTSTRPIEGNYSAASVWISWPDASGDVPEVYTQPPKDRYDWSTEEYINVDAAQVEREEAKLDALTWAVIWAERSQGSVVAGDMMDALSKIWHEAVLERLTMWKASGRQDM